MVSQISDPIVLSQKKIIFSYGVGEVIVVESEVVETALRRRK